MSLPKFEYLFLNKIAPLLTWHKFDHEEFGRLYQESEYKLSLPLGTILKDAEGFLRLVGDAFGNTEDQGCGCCSRPIEFVEIAFLAELIGIGAEPAESDVHLMSVAEVGAAPHVWMPFWRADLRTVDDVLQWMRDGRPRIRNIGRKRAGIMIDAVQRLTGTEGERCTD